VRRLDTPRSSLRPGTRLGRYEVISPLGAGGMAEIYLARVRGIEGFEKQVALKRLRPELATGREYQTMFLDEARMLAPLSHANIVNAHELAFDGETYLYAMEYVPGMDVRSLVRMCQVRGTSLPESHALRIVVEACAGLHAAHEHGIVHRDVSPANILVSRDGCVKLIDFGVAISPQRETVTGTGAAKGKVGYMSPEQVRNEPLDRRSDLFALGTVLWELTVGRRLFAGDSDYETLDAIARGQVPSPGDLVDGYSIELEAIVMRCLQQVPARRYQTAQALQLDLERYALHTEQSLSAVGLGHFIRTTVSGQTKLDDDERVARPIRRATTNRALTA